MDNSQASTTKKFSFEKHNFVENDPEKKNILITVSQLVTREYTYGYMFPLVEVLQKKFNIYYFYEGGVKPLDQFGMKNVYRLNKGEYNRFKDPTTQNFFRKAETSDSESRNQKLVDECVQGFFAKEPKFSSVIVIDNHNLMLPFNVYSKHPKIKHLFNDYFDIFDDDLDAIEEVKRINEKLFNKTARAFSPLAFRYYYKNIMLSVINYVSKTQDAKVHIMIMDPSAAIPFFDYNKIKHKFWYFTDDKRHHRNLHAFPISEMQHLVYEPLWQKLSPLKNDLLSNFFSTEKIPFFFAGSLLNDKGKRKYIWQEFFRDFSYPSSKLFFKVSLIYGMNKSDFDHLKHSVSQHSNFCGDFLPNAEYINILKNSKTAFIARNVSANGGLTYRHIQYLYFGVLPLFDYLYDPDFLWIPREFQEKLTVKNHQELQERVQFYDQNENERLAVLHDMQKFFDVQGWLDNWELKLSQSQMIKELWQES